MTQHHPLTVEDIDGDFMVIRNHPTLNGVVMAMDANDQHVAIACANSTNTLFGGLTVDQKRALTALRIRVVDITT
jgi:hypothetical protein